MKCSTWKRYLSGSTKRSERSVINNRNRKTVNRLKTMIVDKVDSYIYRRHYSKRSRVDKN